MKILHITIILIFAVLITSNSVLAQNVANSTNSVPSNAIRTPNGGWITPLQTTNSSGGNLTMHYEVRKPVTGYANPGPPPDPVFLTDWRENIDNFLTGHQILLRADVNPEYDVKTRFVEINMTSDTGFAYDDKEQVTFGPNDNHMKQVIWEFIPTLAGKYTVEKFSDGTHTSSTYFSVSDSEPMPSTPVLVSPLRQFKWGVLPENIQCEPNFVLLTRSDNDNSPVCVKPDTAQKLVGRGWGVSTIVPIHDVLNQEMNGKLSGNVVLAGGPPSLVGPKANYKVDVYSSDGITIVGKTFSDAQGNYSIQLPAGNYTIYAPDHPIRQIHHVSIISGKNAILNIIYGTGYR